MPVFVHLTPARYVQRIRKSGIKRGQRGVFCLPVLPNYHVSHQWLRELKRRGQRTIVAIHFRLGSEEEVWVGRYNEPHQQVTAGVAIAIIMRASDAQGYEVIIPHSISPSAIHRVRFAPQIVGWRYMPNAHQRKACLCPWCIRGDIKSQRLKRYYEKREKAEAP